jgi:hypothetical protein
MKEQLNTPSNPEIAPKEEFLDLRKNAKESLKMAAAFCAAVAITALAVKVSDMNLHAPRFDETKRYAHLYECTDAFETSRNYSRPSLADGDSNRIPLDTCIDQVRTVPTTTAITPKE